MSRSLSLRAAALLFAAVAATSSLACAPPNPKGPVELDDSSAVVGIDADANGIRDDIDAVIANLGVDGATRTYLAEAMELEQSIMALRPDGDPTNAAAAAYDIASEVNALITCVPDGVDAAAARDHAENLRLLVPNTDARQAQIEAFAELIDGRTFPAPTC